MNWMSFVVFAATIVAQPLVSPEVLEPSVLNETEHALDLVPTNVVPMSVAAQDFAMFYETNGMSATARAISLVSSQKDGSWYWRGTNVTPVAVQLLKQVSGRKCPGAR